jgi:hypothetical protein
MNPIINHLPQEMICHTLSFLNLQQVVASAFLNKVWQKIINSNQLWEKIFTGMTFPSNVNPLKFIRDCSVDSEEKVILALKNFADKILLNQQGKFTCRFALEPQHIISGIFRFNLEFNSETDPSEFNEQIKEFDRMIFRRNLNGVGKKTITQNNS